jgi:hypothetical protein
MITRRRWCMLVPRSKPRLRAFALFKFFTLLRYQLLILLAFALVVIIGGEELLVMIVQLLVVVCVLF